MMTTHSVQYHQTASQCAMAYQQQKMSDIECSYQVERQRKVVIFDWDDTLIPTTALFRGNEQVSGAELERFGAATLELMAKYIETFSAENIYIVTNGKDEWVEKSLDILSSRQRALSGFDYWAQIRQLLAIHFHGHIISARSIFEGAFPKQTAVWKALVFEQIALEHFDGSDAESGCAIISIGDSSDEFTASLSAQQAMSAQLGPEAVKLVRFKLERSPSREVMLKQLDVLCRCSTEVAIDIDQSLDILVADFL